MKRNRSFLPFLILLVVVIGCRSAEVLPTEKDLFVRVSDLSVLGVDAGGGEQYEKFTKTKYFDGSVDIDYEFEPPESDSYIYLTETITYEPKRSDAKLGQLTEDSVIGIALKVQGLDKVEIPNFYRYGESSAFYVLQKDGAKIGNYFTALENGKIYSLFIVGVYIDDEETWRELVEPKLKLFSEYKPK